MPFGVFLEHLPSEGKQSLRVTGCYYPEPLNLIVTSSSISSLPRRASSYITSRFDLTLKRTTFVSCIPTDQCQQSDDNDDAFVHI